jgi:uncharacterized protein YfbU (UPF0304 family)
MDTNMQLSQGEKLILFMLAEIYQKLGIKDGIDPKFVEEAITGGQTWGLEWKYTGVFDATETSESVRNEAMNLLDMWDTLEFSYAKLSEDDKKRVDVEAAPFAGPVRFRGFDGNHEAEYIGVARFVTGYLDRFSGFVGRDLDSHIPSLEAYRRMYQVFDRTRRTIGMDGLGPNAIIAVLKEMIHPENRR